MVKMRSAAVSQEEVLDAGNGVNAKVFEMVRELLKTAQTHLAAFARGLRAHGMEHVQELRELAEGFRSVAIERLQELQARSVAILGLATREQIAQLSKDLGRLARRLDKPKRVRKARKGDEGTAES
jgi:hypothetical protein